MAKLGTAAMETRPLQPASMQGLFEALTEGWESQEVDPITGEPVVIHALIPALRQAVFGGMESTGGSSGFSPKMPIDSGALDLYESIDQEMSEAWSSAFPGQIPGAGAMEQLLAQFVAVTAGNPAGELAAITISEQRVDHPGTIYEHWWVERGTLELTPEALMKRWVSRIRDFFNPPRRREITTPCVSCGEEWGWKMDAGEAKPYRVFVFEQDDHGNTLAAKCLSCSEVWTLLQMRDLAALIASQALDRQSAQEATA